MFSFESGGRGVDFRSISVEKIMFSLEPGCGGGGDFWSTFRFSVFERRFGFSFVRLFVRLFVRSFVFVNVNFNVNVNVNDKIGKCFG